MTRTEFLREQMVECKNKSARTVIPADEWSTSNMDCSLCERRAYSITKIYENMPVYIGEQELIVGTRTMFAGVGGNEDGHDVSAYALWTQIQYVNQSDIDYFGVNESFFNKGHRTPDYSILLEKGIDGIIAQANERIERGGISDWQKDFLKSVIIAYEGFSTLIRRYSEHAAALAEKETSPERKKELEKLRDMCAYLAHGPARDFYEAVQLFWFGHIAVIVESCEFVCYGRLDVILGRYLPEGRTPEAQQLIECLIIKMYDQADLKQTYLQRYSAQLNVTLGGVDSQGNDAVNHVTYMILDAVDKVRLTEPLIAARINSVNPPEFLHRVCELSVAGINTIAYYNDDLFIDSLNLAGIPLEYARQYGFDLCQDINIPGRGDFYCWFIPLVKELLNYIPKVLDCGSFDELMNGYLEFLAGKIDKTLTRFSATEKGFHEFYSGNYEYFLNGVKEKRFPSRAGLSSLMCTTPLLSGLYHGCIESATDVAADGCELKNKGLFLSSPTETINSLAAIKKLVFDTKTYTLAQVYEACENDFAGIDGEVMRSRLWNAPKWGNDDDYVDSIARVLLETACKEINKHKNWVGSQWLAGIHQSHPIPTGESLPATPDGRHKGAPTSVTLTPSNGTIKNGPLAALKSAAKIDYRVYQWNFCVMLSYHKDTTFKGNDGATVLNDLITAYFKMGGTQHQPNVSDVNALKDAQIHPELHKDLIVRLWGVSVNFVDIPKNLQDEIIQRYI